MDSARHQHDTPLPDAIDLAAAIRAGATILDLAVDYDHSSTTIRHRITTGGYSADTGEPIGGDTLDPISEYTKFELEPWTVDALCVQTDPEAFFPEKGGSTREAKAICLRCHVRTECLDYALRNQERFGIWGGMSERDRRKLTKATPC